MKQFCLGIIIAIGLTLVAFGQSSNPLLGTWKLNVAKSTYPVQVPAPKSAITTFAPDGQNVINTAETIDTQGQASKIVFTHIYDGKPHPVTGVPSNIYTEVTYNRLNISTWNWVRSKDGKTVQIGSLVTSDDDKLLTVTTILTDANGQLVRVVTVWDKQ
jgi:hypothetical protein